MAVHNDQKQKVGEYLQSLTGYYVILSLVPTIADSTPIEFILGYEPTQETDGYQAQPCDPDAGSIVSGKYKLEDIDVEFVERIDGAGYQYKYAVLLQGVTASRNKPIADIDAATNVITLVAHGLVNGDRVCVASSGTLAGGIPQQVDNPACSTRLWAESLTADTFKLHSNVGLSAEVDIADSGSGTHRLIYANGDVFDYGQFSVTTVAPGQVKPIVFRKNVEEK